TTLVRRLQGALLEAVHIAPEARDAVGVNPAKVGEDEDVRRHAGIFRGDTQLGEDLFAESTEGLLLNRERVRHPRAPSAQPKRPCPYKLAVPTSNSISVFDGVRLGRISVRAPLPRIR